MGCVKAALMSRLIVGKFENQTQPLSTVWQKNIGSTKQICVIFSIVGIL